MNKTFDEWWSKSIWRNEKPDPAMVFAWHGGYESGFADALAQVKDDGDPKYPEFLPQTLLEKLHP